LNAEQLALWAAIRANPDDDTPRLVYADWLQENGEEDRAEFIRVQCQLAAIGSDRRKGRKQRPSLEALEKKLLRSHGEKWLASFRKVLKGSDRFRSDDEWLAKLGFTRGFVSGLSSCLEAAARIAIAGDALEPVNQIEVLECAARYEYERVLQIGRWVGAGCVVAFSVAGASDKDIAAIVRHGHMTGVSRLGLWYGKVSDDGIEELSGWLHAGRLRHLDLQDNPITDLGALALADSPHLDNLRRIQLYRTRIGPKGRKRLRERFGEKLSIETEPK
jgi:uncharacterized protein (TIGR02996 family)